MPPCPHAGCMPPCMLHAPCPHACCMPMLHAPMPPCMLLAMASGLAHPALQEIRGFVARQTQDGKAGSSVLVVITVSVCACSGFCRVLEGPPRAGCAHIRWPVICGLRPVRATTTSLCASRRPCTRGWTLSCSTRATGSLRACGGFAGWAVLRISPAQMHQLDDGGVCPQLRIRCVTRPGLPSAAVSTCGTMTGSTGSSTGCARMARYVPGHMWERKHARTTVMQHA